MDSSPPGVARGTFILDIERQNPADSEMIFQEKRKLICYKNMESRSYPASHIYL
jgi:hypothetical protein